MYVIFVYAFASRKTEFACIMLRVAGGRSATSDVDGVTPRWQTGRDVTGDRVCCKTQPFDMQYIVLRYAVEYY
jgi:hypothetical protein